MKDEQKIRICTMVRGERRYFSHWKQYHEERGFGPITVFVDDPDEWELYEAEDKRPVPHEGERRQLLVFNEYLEASRMEDGWCLFLDTDEYADFDANSVQFLLENDKQNHAFRFLPIPYVADSDEYRWNCADKPVTERFTRASFDSRGQYGKLLIKLGVGIGLASSHEACVMKYENGERRPCAGVFAGVRPAYSVMHFVTKSLEEWLERHFQPEAGEGAEAEASGGRCGTGGGGSESKRRRSPRSQRRAVPGLGTELPYLQ